MSTEVETKEVTKRVKNSIEGNVISFVWPDASKVSFDVTNLSDEIKTNLFFKGLVARLSGLSQEDATKAFAELEAGTWTNRAASGPVFSYTVRALHHHQTSKDKEVTLEAVQAWYDKQDKSTQRKLVLDKGIHLIVEQLKKADAEAGLKKAKTSAKGKASLLETFEMWSIPPSDHIN